MPRKGYESLNALDPNSQKTREAFIAKIQIEHLLKWGPATRYYEILSVAEVLEQPTSVHKGLNREGKENALCYVGKPHRFGDGWNSPGFPGMVFLVFVTDDDVIFEWRWEAEDSQRAGYPCDCA